MIRGENELNIFHIKEGGDAESFPENIDEKGKVNFEAGSFPEFYISKLLCLWPHQSFPYIYDFTVKIKYRLKTYIFSFVFMQIFVRRNVMRIGKLGNITKKPSLIF